jgi:hypothetical protein
MCPVCTVGVVAGLGISRLLGIDDVVSAIWIGAFILSFSFITNDWIAGKWPKFNPKYYYFPMFVLMYLFVLIPLRLNGTIGIIGNSLWGVDKIVLGIIVGSLTLLLGGYADKYQRKKFKKIFFNFQKVVFPIVALIILSVVFYYITKQ